MRGKQVKRWRNETAHVRATVGSNAALCGSRPGDLAGNGEALRENSNGYQHCLAILRKHSA